MHETRGWDDAKEVTFLSVQRKKHTHYRYFPVEPDLPPVYITREDVEKLRAKLPELPLQYERFVST